MQVKELINSEYKEMQQHLLMFDANPENKLSYFNIYKNDKLIGRSNYEAALLRFLLNVKLAPDSETDDLYISFDYETTEYHKEIKHKILKNGRLDIAHHSYFSDILNMLMTSTN